MSRTNVFFIFTKTACISLGALLCFNVLISMILSSIHTGHFLTLAAGVAIFLFGILYKTLNKKIPTWIKSIFLVALIIAVVFMLFLLLFGLSDNATYTEDAVIVLGAGIKGEIPSEKLKLRLDRAADCYSQNNDIVIVVSGGMGPGEDITEALAMQRYLTKKGVPESNIIKEECATSTYENFTLSKKLLDEYFDGDYTVAFITNDYHVYRAGTVASEAGFKDVTHIHASTPWYDVIPSTARECIAALKLWLQ